MYKKVHEWAFQKLHIDYDYYLGFHYLRPYIGCRNDSDDTSNQRSIWVQGLGVAIYFGWW
jgi:hypothetical protein